MRDYGYLEHMGMGISRKIVLGIRIHNGTEPVVSRIKSGSPFGCVNKSHQSQIREQLHQ
jgi:hypothetical protein